MVGANGSTWAMFQLYSGSGLFQAFFFLALIYLWVREERKGIKSILVYASLAILGVFFCPLSSYLVGTVLGEEEIYYRLLWLLPSGMIIIYAGARLVLAQKKKWRQYLNAFVIAIFICVGGDYVYDSPVLTPSENLYHVPQSVVNICDEIVIEGREVKALMPHELIQYVRQYTPMVVMPYGYENLVERWRFENDLKDEMNKEISNAQVVATLAKESGCHYIVLNQNHKMDGSLSDFGYSLMNEVDGYEIYLNDDAYLGLWDEE